MTYHPPTNDSFAQEDAIHPDEQPPQRGTPPAEQPTSPLSPPQQSGSPASPEANEPPTAEPQPATAPPPGQASYPRSGSPQRTRPAAAARTFWKALPLLGQVAGIAGLLLVIFFFLPWSFTPDISAASTQITNRIPTAWHSGWSTASGVPLFGGTTNFTIFPQLWLVLVGAVALIVIAGLLGSHRINLRLAALLVTSVSLVALLLEILFLVQINSFQGAMDDLAGGRLNQTLYGVSWGFWLGLVATIVALGVGAYMLYQEYAPGETRRPQAPRFGGEQPPYSTA
jgi:hypothetical protein